MVESLFFMQIIIIITLVLSSCLFIFHNENKKVLGRDYNEEINLMKKAYEK